MKIGDKVRLDMVGDVKEIWVDSGRHFASVVFCQDDDSNYRVFAAFEARHFRVVEDGDSSEDTGPEIVPGSVVCLKSGGPAMTVEQIQHDLVSCTWYDERRGEFGEAVFGREALEIAQ